MIALSTPWLPLAQRRVFRALLFAQAQPGTVHDLGADRGDAGAELAVLATLCDNACTLADHAGLLQPGDRSRLGALPAEVAVAGFVLTRGDAPPPSTVTCGTAMAPERGATVIVRCTALGAGAALVLTGPGIADATTLRVAGIDPAWWPVRAHWCAQPPAGVDLILCAPQHIAAIPRSTRVAV
jgi:alpha-D-ribose 1-methylphosphonate 5-triphosphate synthase subunit PhnH